MKSKVTKSRISSLLERNKSERGNMFFFMFGMIMVMILVVGLAIDTAGTVSARQSTQNSLTSATVAAASQLNNQGLIDSNRARDVAYELYGKNRLNAPMLRCATAADASRVGGTLRKVDGCGFVVTHFSVTSSGQRGTAAVTMGTYECSPNTFLAVAIDEQCFHIASTGRIANSLEQN